MTTAEIESLADRGNLANHDFNVGMVLREQIIPTFLLDVEREAGKPYWLRRQDSLSVVASATDRDYDLPAEFSRMDGDVLITTDNLTEYPPLKYIGEDPDQVSRAESATGQTRPSGFYFVPGSTTGLLAVRFNTFPEAAYTVRYVYYIKVPFTDYTTKVDMRIYIPDQFHIALVHALRAAIMADRYGIRDGRAQDEQGRYSNVINGMKLHKEAAPRNHAVFVR
jgi:hypothetical protein